MTETCRNIFKSFNINNLSLRIGWCTDQVSIILLSVQNVLLHRPTFHTGRDLHEKATTPYLTHTPIMVKDKGKVIPIIGLCGPEGG